MNIVLTGNIGCGKSTVGKKLSELLGFQLYDVDKMVHDLYENESFKVALMAEFGTIERHQVSQMFFQHPEKKKVLEDLSITILRPVVTQLLQQPNTIVEYPLYWEMGEIPGENQVVVAVICDPDVQFARVRSRNSFTDERISTIVNAQMPQEEKAERSHIVIDTTDFSTVDAQLKVMWDGF